MCCQEVSHLNQPESPGGGVDHCIVHEEALIGASQSIIKFDVGQILGDPVDLRSGVLSTDDQSRATKQEQANLCAVTVLCAST